MTTQIDRANEIFQKISEIATHGSVEVIAASKNVTLDIIKDVLNNTPIQVAGENRVQELISKYDDSLRWDFIGQLQTNKVKYIIDKVRIIHSVDRLNLLETIDKEATKIDKVQDILIQVNTGEETQKGGLYPKDVMAFAEDVSKRSNVRLVGLMAVTPLWGDEAELQKCFDTAYNIFEQLKKSYSSIKYLSMGMSNDYAQAIKSGANLVRLGRAIFGERV